VLSDMLSAEDFAALTTQTLHDRFLRIDTSKLTDEELRKVSGSAGVTDLYKQILKQITAAGPA